MNKIAVDTESEIINCEMRSPFSYLATLTHYGQIRDAVEKESIFTPIDQDGEALSMLQFEHRHLLAELPADLAKL